MRTARRYGLRPGEMLFDAGIHWKVMRSLEAWWRRGRPDIVHLSLLNLLEKAPVGGLRRSTCTSRTAE